MNIKELRVLSEPELREKLAELHKELMKDNAQKALGAALKNPGKLRQARKAVAKINMLLHQKPASPQESGSRVVGKKIKGTFTKEAQ